MGHELGLMLINTIRKVPSIVHTSIASRADPTRIWTPRRWHIIFLPYMLSLGSPRWIYLQLSPHYSSPRHTSNTPSESQIYLPEGELMNVRPAVRQMTLQALSALHIPRSGMEREPFPLSMSKVIRMIEKEQDTGVLNVLLRLLRSLLDVSQRNVRALRVVTNISDCIPSYKE